LIDSVLPELAPLRSCIAGQGRPDVWSHTVAAIARTTTSPRLPASFALRPPAQRRLLRWALLLHDIAKPETLVVSGDGKPTFHGHEVLGARRAESLLRRLILPRAERRRICRLIRFHLRPGHLADSGAPPRGMRRLVREAGDDLPLLVLHSAADARASGTPDAAARWRRLRAVLHELLELGRARRDLPAEPLLDGKQVMSLLNIGPGPEVGRFLERLRERQEAGTIRTREEALAALRRMARAGG
jgi:poly(A) polymerase